MTLFPLYLSANQTSGRNDLLLCDAPEMKRLSFVMANVTVMIIIAFLKQCTQ